MNMAFTLGKFLCLTVVLAFITGCAATPDAVETTEEEEFRDSPLITTEEVAQIMEAKLAYTQAVVEGMSLGNFERVERNARMLADLSEHAAWFVHDTVTYVAISEDFRQIALTLASQAQQGDIAAITTTYGRLVHSCVACHQYLRRERQQKELPGAVSRVW